MTALADLPKEGREACVALAASTVWPAEEWAIAVGKLSASEIYNEGVGLQQLVVMVLATQREPSAVVTLLIETHQAMRARESATQGLQSL